MTETTTDDATRIAMRWLGLRDLGTRFADEDDGDDGPQADCECEDCEAMRAEQRLAVDVAQATEDVITAAIRITRSAASQIGNNQPLEES